jgi:hypothetical protein
MKRNQKPQKELNDVPKKLHPLFEAPKEWFEMENSRIETALGPFADVSDLSPNGVTFYVSVKDQVRMNYVKEWQENDYIGIKNNVKTVHSKEEATNQKDPQPCLWIVSDANLIHIYQYEPFDERVTTQNDLAANLSEIFDESSVDWETLLQAVAEVAEWQF